MTYFLRRGRAGAVSALLLTIGLAGCSSGSRSPSGPVGGGNGPGGNGGGVPTVPNGFAVFTRFQTSNAVAEPWLTSFDGSDVRSLGIGLPGGGNVMLGSARMSPDGAHLAVIVETLTNFQYAIVDTATGTPFMLPFVDDHADGAYFLFSPDSQHLLLYRQNAQGDDRAYLMNANGTGLSLLSIDAPDQRPGPWSPTSTHFVCQVEHENVEPHLYLYNTVANIVADMMPAVGIDRDTDNVRWSADGSTVSFEFEAELSGTNTEEIWVHDVATGATHPMVATDELRAYGLSSDGSWVAWDVSTGVATSEERLFLGPTMGGPPTHLTTAENVGFPTWAPASNRMVWLESHGGGRELWLGDVTGVKRRLHAPLVGQQSVFDFEWSPDGNAVAFVFSEVQSPGMGRLFIADTTTLDPPVQVSDPLAFSSVATPRWSPDGQWLYSVQQPIGASDPVMRAHPRANLFDGRTLGAAYRLLPESYPGPFVAEPYVPTPDSIGVVWVGPNGSNTASVYWGRPDDPALTRPISPAPNAPGLGTVRQLFAY